MKKLIYILSLFAALLIFDSCEKSKVEKCGDFDPFAPVTQEEEMSRGQLQDNGGGGGIIDPDEDDDDLDDDDQIVDPDEDDDDMDDDDDDSINEDREGIKVGGGA